MSIQVQEFDCREGAVGLITLDAPHALNALSADMIATMLATLQSWSANPNICLVMIRGSGEKAFCAGGNIREIYAAITDGDTGTAVEFFSREYLLDYTIRCFPKPIIGWAHGVIMGGGLGLLSACRYRLITPDAALAMPEIRIGLFPDTGASWFLNRLPEGIGQFLGLTGASLNATDALRIGLADMAVSQDGAEDLLNQLADQRWSGDVAADDNRLYRLLNQLDTPSPRSLPASELARCEQVIGRICRGDELVPMVEELLAEPAMSDWWQVSVDNLRQGCPVTAWLVHEQLRRARQMSLKDIFGMEMVMAARCSEGPDFREGIRARLVDRDQAPRWRFGSVAEVPREVVEEHFNPPWPDGESPLQLP